MGEDSGMKSDHDLLIELRTNMNTLCRKVDKMNDTFDKLPCHANYKELDERLGKKVSAGLFYTVVVVFIGIIGGVIGFNYKMDGDQWIHIGQNKEKIVGHMTKGEARFEHLLNTLDMHETDIERLRERGR